MFDGCGVGACLLSQAGPANPEFVREWEQLKKRRYAAELAAQISAKQRLGPAALLLKGSFVDSPAAAAAAAAAQPQQYGRRRSFFGAREGLFSIPAHRPPQLGPAPPSSREEDVHHGRLPAIPASLGRALSCFPGSAPEQPAGAGFPRTMSAAPLGSAANPVPGLGNLAFLGSSGTHAPSWNSNSVR